MQVVHFYVNGKPKELAVQDGEVLTDTLRNQLGLTSVKKGCEVGECGACTVLIDGHAQNSCLFLTTWAEGKHILTGVELVNTGKKYTREELREAISGHLCRCTGYENILRALEKIVGIESE